MKILVCYFSPNGTTKKVARLLTREFKLAEHAVTVLNVTDGADAIEWDAFDVIGFGSPVYHMHVPTPMRRFVAEKIKNLSSSQKVFFYLTYAGITTGRAFFDFCNGIDDDRVVGAFKVFAPNFYDVVDYPDVMAEETVRAFVAQLEENAYAEIAWKKLKALLSYQKPIVDVIFPLTILFEKRRNVPLVFDDEKCVGCQLCVKKCPTHALVVNETIVYSKDACVHCYHCATHCPTSAISADMERLKEMSEMNRKIVGTEVPQNMIYM